MFRIKTLSPSSGLKWRCWELQHLGTEDRDSMSLRKAGIYLRVYKASNPRKTTFQKYLTLIFLWFHHETHSCLLVLFQTLKILNILRLFLTYSCNMTLLLIVISYHVSSTRAAGLNCQYGTRMRWVWLRSPTAAHFNAIVSWCVVLSSLIPWFLSSVLLHFANTV
jgi:hypothetical protein